MEREVNHSERRRSPEPGTQHSGAILHRDTKCRGATYLREAMERTAAGAVVDWAEDYCPSRSPFPEGGGMAGTQDGVGLAQLQINRRTGVGHRERQVFSSA